MTQLALTTNGNLVAMIDGREMYFNTITGDVELIEQKGKKFIVVGEDSNANRIAKAID